MENLLKLKLKEHKTTSQDLENKILILNKNSRYK